MTDGSIHQLVALLHAQLPEDGSPIGNGSLFELLKLAAQHAALPLTEDDFHEARARLVAAGTLKKGKGRGGSSARVLTASEGRPADWLAAATSTASTGTSTTAPQPARSDAADADRPAFALQGEVQPAELPFNAPAPAPARKPAGRPQASAAPGDPQVLSYRHPDRRANNPEVGLVSEASDPERPKAVWAYDPHLDPVLNFDSARARAETLIDNALAGDDSAAMRAALEELRRLGSPYLQWTGKAERTSFEVDTVSLHVHERIDPMSILSAVSKAREWSTTKKTKGAKHRSGGVQPGLFEAPFENLPLRDAVDFYRHDKGWSNRLIAGDSLLVMNSLLQKESMAGQVQMIYIDPPYGIKYGSNFQPFTNKRDVKDRADADLTQEPEMIKAFRDTWELGIHSYLTYLRDRLLLARELLAESGSIFIQIGDENVHLIRNLLDDIFGPENFLSEITLKKTGGQSSKTLPGVCDYIVWYAREKSKVKYRSLYSEKDPGEEGAKQYNWAEFESGSRRPLGKNEISNGHKGRTLQPYPLVSMGEGKEDDIFHWRGAPFSPSKGRHWSVADPGLPRLDLSGRLMALGKTLRFVNFLDDYPVTPLTNLWSDTQTSGFVGDRYYVVQTLPMAIERCLLMTTDAGDLALDPTCGSGTTAFVAEKWGRRWITCDTSRVAVTLAKQRLMTASFDYFELRYPHEGLKGGFIYKTVPHVTLKSIANNADIDSIHDRLHPPVLAELDNLNGALQAAPPLDPVAITEGVRKGSEVDFNRKHAALQEWEVPFPRDWPLDDEGQPNRAREAEILPAGWPARLLPAFKAFHQARQRMQAAMDASIAAHADNETLYDQPERAKNKLRITGPFSVEAVPFPTVLNLDVGDTPQTGSEFTADAAVARSGATSRHAQWRDELLKTGIRGKAGQMLNFTALETLAGTTCLHCSGHLETGERTVLSFGPEHGALEQRQVEHAIREAGELFPLPKMIVFCAFTFDPEAAKDIDAFKGITALKAQMNTDLLTEDLKKARASNQSFWLMGQPDVELRRAAPGAGDGLWQVEVNGFDYFDTTKGELVSGGKSRIAMWSLDTDYDGRSLFPHQVFFPMAGKDDGWGKLKKDIRAELDEGKLEAFRGTVSLPFEAGAQRRVAVKIVDDRGIESLKVMAVPVLAGAAKE